MLTRSIPGFLFLLFTCTGLYAQIESVKIGEQVWMKKNLEVSKFRNGDPIPEVRDAAAWTAAGNAKQPAWCYYENDPANGATYGKLFNWYTVTDPRGLCPTGWHVPADEEWTVLINHLGGEAGTKMKSTSGWDSYNSSDTKTCPNCESWNQEYRSKVPCHVCKDTRIVTSSSVSISGNGTNASGFSGLPGGSRNSNGDFNNIGRNGYWWSSSEYSTYYAWYRNLFHLDGSVNRSYFSKLYGFSVRCLRD